MNTRARRIAAVLGVAVILAIIAVPVIEAQTDYRFNFPFGIRTNNSGASFFVRQDGSGSMATFRDGATDEFTIDQSSSTTTNPLIITGSGDAYQLSVQAAATQSTPAVVIKNASGTPVAYVDGSGVITAIGAAVSGTAVFNGGLQVKGLTSNATPTAVAVVNATAVALTSSEQWVTAAGTATIPLTSPLAGTRGCLMNTGSVAITVADSGTQILTGSHTMGQYDRLCWFSDGTNIIETSYTDN